MKPLHIVIALILTLIGVGGMVGYKVFDDASLTASTDSANVRETVNIGVDSWAGYTVLCSTETRRLALVDGILVKCHDDKANYTDRMAKLASEELQMAAAAVDGYVLAGDAVKYPGSVTFVIDESQGGDVIIANASVAKNINDLKNRSGVKIAFTPDSPSQTLLTKWSSDFDVKINDPKAITLVHANGAADAAKKLQNGEVDVAVVWEPHASKLLSNANFVKLIGTESTKNLIVDVLLTNQRYAKSNPDVMKTVVKSYFLALEHYKTNTKEFDDEIIRYAGASRDQVDAIKAGINWVDLPHNAADWLGISQTGGKAQRQLYDTFNSAVRLYVNSGDFTTSPIPGDDPFRLIDSSAFNDVYTLGMTGKLGVMFQPITVIKDVSVTRPFKKLSPGRWAKLKDIGSLKLQAITFKRGTYELESTGQSAFKSLVEMLETYPNYRIKVVGHSGKRGDQAANMVLSKKRSISAAKYLMDKYGIDKNRIYAYGVGNGQPPRRETGETKRAYNARWPRVELILVEG